MPTGVMQWIDPTADEARIVSHGRRYTARVGDVEPRARHAGARVHFDIDHGRAGDVATSVVLREGTRVAPRQRRFGDLVGATTKEDKAAPSPLDDARDGVRHPIRVAERWVERIADGDLDGASRSYAPTASVHDSGSVTVGPGRIRVALSRSPHLDHMTTAPESIEVDGDTIRIRWGAPEGGAEVLETHLAVERGEIVEQWIGEVRTVEDVPEPIGPVRISVEGPVSQDAREYAVDKLMKAASTVGEPIRGLDVRLEWLPDPARERRARARVTLDIDGEPVRARVLAPTMHEAADLLESRLVDRLRHRASHRRSLRRRGPTGGDGQWRHGDLASRSLHPFSAAEVERSVVERPTWSPEPCTLDEAVYDLETLDLEFLLFTDLASGRDAVVHRLPTGAYGVRLSEPPSDELRTGSTAAIETDPHAAPHLDLAEAREHLDETHEPWIFYADAQDGRGRILYRRDDGHDGLIGPRSPSGDAVET